MAQSNELNDYGEKVPFDPNIPMESFSKEFLLQIMRCWSEFWEAMQATLINKAMEMPEVGVLNGSELFSRTIDEVAPVIYGKVADICKVDKNSLLGRIKAGRFIMDNMTDKYPGEYEFISDDEVRVTYKHCYVVDQGTVNDVRALHMICKYGEPRIALAYMNYPGCRKIHVDMLKIPEKLPVSEGEPYCIWRFRWEDQVPENERGYRWEKRKSRSASQQ